MEAMQAAFVKFFGRAGTRTAPDARVLGVLARTGAHWAGTYPAGRRPRSVRDGDRMFMAQLVARGGVADIAVFGRALALAGRGNVDPRAAYRQQPAVRLSHEGRAWLEARLDEAFARVGRLSAAQMARLDWPTGLSARRSLRTA
jgi:hypothetical protein